MIVKALKISIVVAVILAALALLCLGVRLVPGVVVFAGARNLAAEAGADGDTALAVALVAGAIAAAFLGWRGFSWRKAGVLTLVVPLALATYFAGKSFLRNRTGIPPDPDRVRWFSNDGTPMLFFARQPNGSLIFSARPGFHYRTGQRLQGVTADLYQEWQQLKGKQAAKLQESAALRERMERLRSEAEAQQKALKAQIRASDDKLAEEKTARAETERKLQQQAEEALAVEAKLVRQKVAADEQRKQLDEQIRAAEEKVRLEKEARAQSERELQERAAEALAVAAKAAQEAHDTEEKRKELEMRAAEEKVRQQNEAGKELQRRAEEALAAATKVQTEVERAKREFREQLSERTAELKQMRQNVEAQLRSAQVKLRAEREETSKSKMQKELDDAKVLAKQIRHELEEQKIRAKKAEVAASSRKPAATTPPPLHQNSTVTIGIRNDTRFTMHVSFSSWRNRVWLPDRAVVAAGQTATISLAGTSGAPVYYRAWAADNPSLQWIQNEAITTFGGADSLISLVERRWTRECCFSQ